MIGSVLLQCRWRALKAQLTPHCPNFKRLSTLAAFRARKNIIASLHQAKDGEVQFVIFD
jgi:hypothetical protein